MRHGPIQRAGKQARNAFAILAIVLLVGGVGAVSPLIAFVLAGLSWAAYVLYVETRAHDASARTMNSNTTGPSTPRPPSSAAQRLGA